MISVSDRFLEALRNDHTEETRVELWVAGEKEDDLLIDGASSSLTCDAKSETAMRYCDVQLADETVPGAVPDKLWPIGPELRIFSGLIFPDGTEEMIAQGRYRLSRPASSEDGTKPVETTLQGYDYSQVIARNRFAKPFTLQAGNVVDAIIAIAENRLTIIDFEINAVSSPYTIPEMVLQHGGQSNPWKDMKDIGESAGLDVFFDHEGRLSIRPINDPTTDPPVFQYLDDADSILTGISRVIDEERVYSGVVASSSNPDSEPRYAEIWDEDPSSPTYIGTYGLVPYFMDTQFIPQAQLDRLSEAVAAKLAQVKGIIENVEFEAIANYAHEPGDIISIRRSKLNVNTTSVIDAFRRKLEPGSPMQFTTRKTRAEDL